MLRCIEKAQVRNRGRYAGMNKQRRGVVRKAASLLTGRMTCHSSDHSPCPLRRKSTSADTRVGATGRQHQASVHVVVGMHTLLLLLVMVVHDLVMVVHDLPRRLRRSLEPLRPGA